MTEKLRLVAAIQAAKWSEMSDALNAAGDRFADEASVLANRQTHKDGEFEAGIYHQMYTATAEHLWKAAELAGQMEGDE